MFDGPETRLHDLQIRSLLWIQPSFPTVFQNREAKMLHSPSVDPSSSEWQTLCSAALEIPGSGALNSR